VLPCGAGKTLVGVAAMARTGAHTLVLVTNAVAGRPWRGELHPPPPPRGGGRIRHGSKSFPTLVASLCARISISPPLFSYVLEFHACSEKCFFEKKATPLGQNGTLLTTLKTANGAFGQFITLSLSH